MPKRQQLKSQYVNYYGTLILYMITILPFLSLSGVKKLLGENILLSYQTGAMLILCAMVFLRARWVRINLFSGLYIVLQALIMVVTTVNYGFSFGIMVSVCAGIFLVLLMQKDAAIIVRALVVIAIAATFLNLIPMLQLGISDKEQYFIGGKNAFSMFLVPAGFAVVINKLIRNGRAGELEIVYLVLAAVCVIWARSAAGIVTALAMICTLAWVKKFKPNVLVTVLAMAGVYILLAFFSEVLVGSGWWHRVTQWLGKDVTLTSRFSIWERTIEIFRENWLFGVGRGVQIKYINSWGRTRIGSEAHNFLLELLLEGGVVGLVLFCVYFWLAVRKLDMNSKLHRVVLMANIVILINGLVESVNNKLVLSLFVALAHACSQKKIYEKNYLSMSRSDPG